MNIHVYLYTRYVQFFVILYVMKSKKQGYFEEVNNKKMTLIFTLLHHKHKDILSSIYKIFSISIFKKCQKTQLQPWVKGQVMTKKKYSCISICRVFNIYYTHVGQYCVHISRFDLLVHVQLVQVQDRDVILAFVLFA